jgi:radical SAM superfamily enzyme with C-terminal helix-hairpin-helix motif
MIFTIIDCYTDEPAGLGVPPYLGTYPRYVAGAVLDSGHSVVYLTIDDIRFHFMDEKTKKQLPKQHKTNIKVRNRTFNADVGRILEETDFLIIICGIHTPGKYLSAYPATVAEIKKYIKDIQCFKILTGPVTFGSGLYGGRKAAEIKEDSAFDLITPNLEYKFPFLLENKFTEDIEIGLNYSRISNISIKGAEIVKQIPNPHFIIAEIETSRGCSREQGCSFCLEPLKGKPEFREQEDIINEMKELNQQGIKNFRLGKQSCIYMYKKTAEELEKLFKGIKHNVQYDILHIDNANPANVTEEKTKIIVEYCTPGNTAAFGVESFDPVVVKENNLNTNPEQTYKAIEIINKYGAERGENGMPKFLPGINLLYGLKGETKNTNNENMKWLKKILDSNLLLRRINIREVVIFPGTKMAEIGDKLLKKNRKMYWKWRNEVRQNIDLPMMKKVVPKDTILKNLRTEIHDGKTTFSRQIGTYPLIVGVKEKLELDKFIDIKITSHMLRSAVGEIILKKE